MSDEVRDPLLSAVAIVRAHLSAASRATSTRTALEATVLEVSVAEDPLQVLTAMAMITGYSLRMTAALGQTSAEELLDVIETTIRGDE